MRKLLIIGTATLMFAVSTASFGAAKPKKPATAIDMSRTKGTTQLAGDNGKMGVTYTIGKGDHAVNFTLKSAEYEPNRVLTQRNTYLAKEDEKFIRLHFTFQNPNRRKITAYHATLKFTFVDDKGVNHNNLRILSKEGEIAPAFYEMLPAQKGDFYAVFLVSADTPIHKLIVQNRTDEPVLRLYFKDGDIKPVPAPFADPADPTGSTVISEAVVDTNTVFPMGVFDFKVLSDEYITTPIGNLKPRKGKQFYVATVEAGNPSTTIKLNLNSGAFKVSVKTDDGEKSSFDFTRMFKTKRDEVHRDDLEPGDKYTCRLIIEIPLDVKVTAMRFLPGTNMRSILVNVK